MKLSALLAVSLLLCALGSFVLADDKNHKYEVGDEVTLWMNKVGPYHNPQESYSFYSLPFCRPTGKSLKKKSNSLGVLLEGHELSDSGLLVKFKEPQSMSKVCDMHINNDAEEIFTEAVKEHYWYQMYIDELPVWGMVGEYMMAEDASNGGASHQGFIYTHREFSISYNGNRIIEVNLTSENPRPITSGSTYPLTFSVQWLETDKSFANRFDRYLDFDFFEHQIHWFSIFNSFMMVVFLCGMVALILMRTLKNDYARYTSEDDELDLEHVADESGWKQVHGDVFHAPKFLTLYAALVGTGYQLLSLVFCVIVLALFGDYYDERGMLMSSALVCYSLTSFMSGFGSGALYKRYGGQKWKQGMMLTAVLLPAVCFCVAFLLNTVAVFYESKSSVSAYTMVSMMFIWLLVACPLLVVGTFVGRSTTVTGDFPVRVNNMHRPIPDNNWYSKPSTLALLSGILPFGSIFIEMYFVFTSFWNYKFYYVYGFMFLVYCILLIVTIFVTIVSTYFLLNAEDYRWQWTSFASGGSTALYVFLYSMYYFMTRTRMSGLLQTSFYFGYMALFCMALFVMTGTVGYLGSNWFVRKIYTVIKSD